MLEIVIGMGTFDQFEGMVDVFDGVVLSSWIVLSTHVVYSLLMFCTRWLSVDGGLVTLNMMMWLLDLVCGVL